MELIDLGDLGFPSKFLNTPKRPRDTIRAVTSEY